VHRSPDGQTRYTCTYAPLGIGNGGAPSIEASIHRIAVMDAACIKRALRDHEQTRLTAYCPELSSEYGLPHAAVWRSVEQMRFDTEQYKPVPRLDALSHWEYPADHYVHLSVTDTEQDYVAYTPSETYGENDRQVRLKFGKYLRKTFPELSDCAIQSAVIELRAKLARSIGALHFTTERARINDIFETRMCAGGSGDYPSCMYGKFDGQTVRPYHVYADSPDLADERDWNARDDDGLELIESKSDCATSY